MKLYMVRHGESVHNARRILQTLENPLSEEGLRQAKALAERFRKIQDINLILSSDLKRAEQTADEISSATGLPVEFTELARERKMPTVTIGLAWEGEEMQKVTGILKQHKHEESWHYSDEENFFEQRTRALKLIQYINSFDGKNILLVSHGHFIRLIVGIMMFGEQISPFEFEKIEDFMKTRNTGITICERKGNNWQLITWNDHAHLG